MREIPISEAKAIGRKYGCDQVVILGRKVGPDGLEAVATWGRDKKHCDAAALVTRFLERKWAELRNRN